MTPMMRRRPRFSVAIQASLALAFLAACSPTVKVQPPDKPIEINMNIKIQQEVVIRIDRALEETFSKNPELFGLPAGTGARQ
jgi:hypothetical protein